MFVLPYFFTFFAFPLLSPSILNTTLLLLLARKYLIAHSTGTVTIPRAMMRRQKKQGNQFPHSKKLLQEPEGNEENRYSDPESNKMKINYAKEPNEAHKNNLKDEIL
jgi:hypothetical protein